MQTANVARYEFRLQLRSLVFWLGAILVAIMLYSEVIQPAVADVRFLRWISQPTTPSSLIQGDASFTAHVERLKTEGVPARIWAPMWADRMAIVFSFAAVFIAAFTFERDRLTGSREIIDARPLGALQYFAGKYLGVVAALLLMAAVMLAAAIATNLWAQAAIDRTTQISAYLAPALSLLVTLLFVPALVMSAALLAGRAAIVIPAFMVYLYTAIAVWPVNFILRSDNTDAFWTMVHSGAAAGNRLAYLAATVALVFAGGLLYRRRRVAG